MAERRKHKIIYVLLIATIIFATIQTIRYSNVITKNETYEKERKELFKKIEQQNIKEAEYQKVLKQLSSEHDKLLIENRKLKTDADIKEEYNQPSNPINDFDWNDILLFFSTKGIIKADTIQ